MPLFYKNLNARFLGFYKFRAFGFCLLFFYKHSNILFFKKLHYSYTVYFCLENPSKVFNFSVELQTKCTWVSPNKVPSAMWISVGNLNLSRNSLNLDQTGAPGTSSLEQTQQCIFLCLTILIALLFPLSSFSMQRISIRPFNLCSPF